MIKPFNIKPLVQHYPKLQPQKSPQWTKLGYWGFHNGFKDLLQGCHIRFVCIVLLFFFSSSPDFCCFLPGEQFFLKNWIQRNQVRSVLLPQVSGLSVCMPYTQVDLSGLSFSSDHVVRPIHHGGKLAFWGEMESKNWSAGKMEAVFADAQNKVERKTAGQLVEHHTTACVCVFSLFGSIQVVHSLDWV